MILGGLSDDLRVCFGVFFEGESPGSFWRCFWLHFGGILGRFWDNFWYNFEGVFYEKRCFTCMGAHFSKVSLYFFVSFLLAGISEIAVLPAWGLIFREFA